MPPAFALALPAGRTQVPAVQQGLMNPALPMLVLLLACPRRAAPPSGVDGVPPYRARTLEGDALAVVRGSTISVDQWSRLLCQLEPAADGYSEADRWSILKHLVAQRLLCEEAVVRGLVRGPHPRNTVSCAQAAHKLLRVEHGEWDRMKAPPISSPLAQALWREHSVELDAEKLLTASVVPCTPAPTSR